MSSKIHWTRDQPHSPGKLRGLSWSVCKACGLVFLRNEFTAWCIRHGCNHADHPGYRAWFRA